MCFTKSSFRILWWVISCCRKSDSLGKKLRVKKVRPVIHSFLLTNISVPLTRTPFPISLSGRCCCYTHVPGTTGWKRRDGIQADSFSITSVLAVKSWYGIFCSCAAMGKARILREETQCTPSMGPKLWLSEGRNATWLYKAQSEPAIHFVYREREALFLQGRNRSQSFLIEQDFALFSPFCDQCSVSHSYGIFHLVLHWNLLPLAILPSMRAS
jgi:hypothetical protein